MSGAEVRGTEAGVLAVPSLKNAGCGLTLKAPFPWFGGKSRVAPFVWKRFGKVRNYVEPFAGSLAVLLGRPRPFEGLETVNDKDGLVSNFWRALQDDPDAVAHYADWPVNENDLHARHAWLVGQRDNLVAGLEGDPEYYVAKVAGWWVWGICCWIGGGWCSGAGPWQVVEVDGARQLVHLSGGVGVKRKLVHMGPGRGINRTRIHLGNAGRGVNRRPVCLKSYMNSLAKRLRGVRVCSGDWLRVCGEAPTVSLGLTAVFLDPPYGHSERDENIYRIDEDVSAAVRAWAVAHGNELRLRIALCGYDGEHSMPKDWSMVRWKPRGGYGSQSNGRGRANAGRECVWFSPHCLRIMDSQRELFAEV